MPQVRLSASLTVTLTAVWLWQIAALPAQEIVPFDLDGPASPSALDQLESELGFSELTRGPVHEAFAEQVSLNPQPGVIVPKQPPQPIEELPPDNQPSGENVIWIGGYWAWSDDDEDFIWISGVWRSVPRGYEWVPGYWAKVDAGYQWVGGFWATADRAEIEYYPEPPASLDLGPTSAAPGDDYFWIPGHWQYRQARYAWSPGYWSVVQPDYVWIPHYYRWTPGGYVLVGGYWDYPLASRGCLFAPVYFHRPVYLVSGWHYTPRVWLDVGPLHFHWFVRPGYCHYYFGDYYADHYLNNGWFAWHTFHRRRHCYDPLFAFNVVHYRRRGIDFHDRAGRWHNHFRNNRELRPQHTFARQREFLAQNRHRDHLHAAALGDSFENAVRNRRGAFTSLSDARRVQAEDSRKRLSQISRQRTELETAAASQVRTPAAADAGSDRPRLTLRQRTGADGTTSVAGTGWSARGSADGAASGGAWRSGAAATESDSRAARGDRRTNSGESAAPVSQLPLRRPQATVSDAGGRRLEERLREAPQSGGWSALRGRTESPQVPLQQAAMDTAAPSRVRTDATSRTGVQTGPQPDRSQSLPLSGAPRGGTAGNWQRGGNPSGGNPKRESAAPIQPLGGAAAPADARQRPQFQRRDTSSSSSAPPRQTAGGAGSSSRFSSPSGIAMPSRAAQTRSADFGGPRSSSQQSPSFGFRNRGAAKSNP